MRHETAYQKRSNCNLVMESPQATLTTIPLANGALAAIVEFSINPAELSTAQQKKISFRTRRVFTSARVARGIKTIKLLALPHKKAIQEVVPWGSPIFLSIAFLHAYPAGTPKSKRIDFAPMPQGADNDNRIKAPQDALVQAGWFPDDRFITTTHITKRRTTGEPRIVVIVSQDTLTANSRRNFMK